MRIFACSKCRNTIFFENVRCTHCGSTLAYFPEHGLVTAIEPVPAPRRAAKDAPQLYRALKHIKGTYRLCANSAAYGVCNSAVRADDPEALCLACRLNDAIPEVSTKPALEAWHALERCKRRVLFSVRELGLPIESRAEQPHNGLMFSFKADDHATRRSAGLININIAEADDAFREKLRKALGERYRTVLGHFRREIGHYYWDRLIQDSAWLAPYRALFGDETESRAEWAETWAHYLHITDTLDTARSHGLVLRPQPVGSALLSHAVSAPAVDTQDFDEMLAALVPVTIALNSLNRSMGLIDPYPFVLGAEVVEKLRFVHDVIGLWNAGEQRQNRSIARWLKLHAQQPAGPAGGLAGQAA